MEKEAGNVEQRLELAGGGVLTLRQEGNRVHLEAERPRDEKGLYKVWIGGAQGGRMLLGTLAPEGNRLRIFRTISQGELARMGCWPVTRGEAVLIFSFPGGERWYRENHPEGLLSDPVLRGQVTGPMLCQKEKEGFRLAAPFRSDGGVPLNALFCLAQVERIEGRPYLVWSFDRTGRPNPPHKARGTGQTNSSDGEYPRG